MANFRPKIGQYATFAPTLNGHDPANFYPIFGPLFGLGLTTLKLLVYVLATAPIDGSKYILQKFWP